MTTCCAKISADVSQKLCLLRSLNYHPNHHNNKYSSSACLHVFKGIISSGRLPLVIVDSAGAAWQDYQCNKSIALLKAVKLAFCLQPAHHWNPVKGDCDLLTSQSPEFWSSTLAHTLQKKKKN